MEITNKVSAGMTLYWHYRGAQTILNQNLVLTNGVNNRYEVDNMYSELHERGWKPILGFMWTPVDKLSLGLSVARVFVYSSSIETMTTIKDPNVVDIVAWEPNSSSQKRKYPYELRAGAAYFPSPELLVSVDMSLFTQVSDPVNGDRVRVLNGAVGTEYFINRSWAVRGGLFSNMANTPDIVASKAGQNEKVDMYGISASISNFSRNTSISLGMNYTMGEGKAQIIQGSSAIQNVTVDGMMVYLSSSYSF